MKAEELRIGNILNVDGNYWTIDTISSEELYFKENIHYNHILNAEPIPLTEEILLKCEGNHSAFYHVFDCVELGLVDDDFINGFYTLYLDGYTKKISYLHQLQNLYFALTGKELEIKL